MLGKIKWIGLFIVSTAGVIWVVNLPSPMIRQPVAKAAPILLLPSFMGMDHDYRGAIDSLEQADQLVSKATSPADIERGAEKVKDAKNHLDNLPVWFLGYYPQTYCNFFGCTWYFTFDEFQSARQRVGRLEAVVFQDKNALTPLAEGQKAVLLAKQQYEQAKNTQERENAIASWQVAIDKLDQISQQTLAGQTAQTQLKAFKRDFENARAGIFIAAAEEFDVEAQKLQPTNSQVSSELWEQAINRLQEIPIKNPRYLEAQKLIAAYQVKLKTVVAPRSTTYIEAGKEYALSAAQASQNPPHTALEWEKIGDLWKKAISQLSNIRVDEPSYVEAQKLLAQYQTNLGIIENRGQVEKESQETLKQANQEIQSLIAHPPADNNRLKAEIQAIITRLNTVKAGTTAYPEAQRLLVLASNKLKQIQKK